MPKDYDECGACGMRYDRHIPGIGNMLASITCPEYRPEDEEGEWVWVPSERDEVVQKD